MKATTCISSIGNYRYLQQVKQCDEKAAYGDEIFARRAMEAAGNYGNPNWLIYKCENCSMWHIKYREVWGTYNQ